jgi:beta-glucosidase
MTMFTKEDTCVFFVFFLWLCVEIGAGFAMPKETTSPSLRRQLPPQVMIGYATDCNDKVATAVRQGVNVVVWSFMEMLRTYDEEVVVAGNSLDFECIRQLIATLDSEGFSDTVHLVSFGGWNGPHLDTSLTAQKWYSIWKERVGDIFHGIDWDLEGHDDLDSPTNVFSVECLDQMGCISRLAKDDGYIIGMAPPQSYLDVQSSKFSRSVNLTEPDRPW